MTIVTFRTKAYDDTMMFGDVAEDLLHMMGMSGTVPSAISAEDVPAARDRLEAAIRALPEEPSQDPEPATGDNQARIPISRRAFPLLQLLKAAEEAEVGVTWS